MRFAKAHAYGNDFLYVHQSLVSGVALSVLAREMCDRYTGIGADGLIIYQHESAHVPMRLINSDGSPAEVSGNGVRALGALVLLHERNVHAEVTVDTVVGPKHLARLDRQGSRQLFRASMGSPLELRQVPLVVGGQVTESGAPGATGEASEAGESLTATVMNFGNPQCVVLGPLPSQERFLRLGALLTKHPYFPHGTNVEFAEVEAPDRVRILIWERGCGPTQSSGTGSCASLIAAATYGGAAREAEVVAPGGTQRVEWGAETVHLTGWAEVVCEGEWLRPLPPA